MPFSNRIQWDLRPNLIAELLDRKRNDRVTILDLTESNPTAAGIEYPADLLESFTNRGALVYEPSACGLRTAREAVATAIPGNVDPERIILTASTSEAYAYLFKLLCNPGDEVLVPRPSYPLFEFLASLESTRVVPYPLHYYEEWTIDMHALESAITPRTRAVVLVNPNNPTGSYLKRSELSALVDICARHDLAIISDEVFSDYGFGEDPRRVTTIAGIDDVLTFALGGLSKMSGLPQMKLGWIALNGPVGLGTAAFTRLELIADTFLSVSTPVQHAAPALIAAKTTVQRQICARTAANFGLLRDYVARERMARILNVEGGWYAILQLPAVKSEQEWIATFLTNDDVLVQPGYFYDFESEPFAVLSLLTRTEVFASGTERIANRIADGMPK